MKKLPCLFLLALLFAVPALAQSANYRFDNFDAQSGIRIETVKTTAVLPASKNVRRTAKYGAPVYGASTRPAELLYTQPRALSTTASQSLDGFTTGDAKIDSYIVDSATRNGVDPVLIYAQMHQESSFKLRAISNKGARGLMQLIPATAARFGVTNIFDAQQNIEGGARYMSFLLNMFGGDVGLALAGYNAGEGAVMKYGGRIPPYRETQEYVRRIMERYELMRDPSAARNAQRLSAAQVAAMRTEQPVPLTIYERNVTAVRLPDGRLQLVSR